MDIYQIHLDPSMCTAGNTWHESNIIPGLSQLKTTSLQWWTMLIHCGLQSSSDEMSVQSRFCEPVPSFKRYQTISCCKVSWNACQLPTILHFLVLGAPKIEVWPWYALSKYKKNLQYLQRISLTHLPETNLRLDSLSTIRTLQTVICTYGIIRVCTSWNTTHMSIYIYVYIYM